MKNEMILFANIYYKVFQSNPSIKLLVRKLFLNNKIYLSAGSSNSEQLPSLRGGVLSPWSVSSEPVYSNNVC